MYKLQLDNVGIRVKDKPSYITHNHQNLSLKGIKIPKDLYYIQWLL